MLRFPKIHKGWMPKRTKNELISVFWLNRSDMFLTFEKRDIEVEMEFGDIPYENIDKKDWHYVRAKQKEIEALKEYRAMEKQAFIIPTKTLEKSQKDLNEYYLKTEHLDFLQQNQRCQKFLKQLGQNSFIFQQSQQNSIDLKNLSPIPNKYLNLKKKYEDTLLYYIKQKKHLDQDEVQFLINADFAKRLGKNDLLQLARNSYFQNNVQDFQVLFQDISIKDQQTFIDSVQYYLNNKKQSIYPLIIFKGNQIDKQLEKKLIQLFNKKNKNSFKQKLYILKVFQNNNCLIPFENKEFLFDEIFFNFCGDQSQNNYVNYCNNKQLFKNFLYRGFLIDRILDYFDIVETQKSFYFATQILSSLKQNKNFSLLLFQYQKTFGEMNLDNKIISNIQKIIDVENNSMEIEIFKKSIDEYHQFNQYSYKPRKWFLKYSFKGDEEEIIISDKLKFEEQKQYNLQKEKIHYYERHKLKDNLQQFSLIEEYDFQYGKKDLVEDKNFVKQDTKDLEIKNIQKAYNKKFNRYEIGKSQVNNMKSAYTMNNIQTILKSQNFFFSRKFDKLKQKIKNRNQNNEQENDKNQKENKKKNQNFFNAEKSINILCKKLSTITSESELEQVYKQILEQQQNHNISGIQLLQILLQFDQYSDVQTDTQNIKKILQRDKLENSDSFTIQYNNQYGQQELSINQGLINKIFYKQNNQEQILSFMEQILNYQTFFLVPTILTMILQNFRSNQESLVYLVKNIWKYNDTDSMIFLSQYIINNNLQVEKILSKNILNYFSTKKYYQSDFIQLYIEFAQIQKQPLQTDSHFKSVLLKLQKFDLEKFYFELNKITLQKIQQLDKKEEKEQSYNESVNQINSNKQEQIFNENTYWSQDNQVILNQNITENKFDSEAFKEYQNKISQIFFYIGYQKNFVDLCKIIVTDLIKSKMINTRTFLMLHQIYTKDVAFVNQIEQDTIDQFKDYFSQNFPKGLNDTTFAEKYINQEMRQQRKAKELYKKYLPDKKNEDEKIDSELQYYSLLKEGKVVELFVRLTQDIITQQKTKLKIFQRQFLQKSFNVTKIQFSSQNIDDIIDSIIQTDNIELMISMLTFMNLPWYNCTEKQHNFAQFLIKNSDNEFAINVLKNKIEQRLYNKEEQKQSRVIEDNQEQEQLENQFFGDQTYIVEEINIPFETMQHLTEKEIRGTRLEIDIKNLRLPKLSKKFSQKYPYKIEKLNLRDKADLLEFNWAETYNNARQQQLSDQELLQKELEELRKRPYLSKYYLEGEKNDIEIIEEDKTTTIEEFDENTKDKMELERIEKLKSSQGRKVITILDEGIEEDEQNHDLIYRRYIPLEFQPHLSEYIYEYNQENEEGHEQVQLHQRISYLNK